MAIELYWATALTGGGANALDSKDGALLVDGVKAFAFVNGVMYVYVLDDDAGGAESSPTKITPDNNPGNKRWILQSVYAASLTLGTPLPIASGGTGQATAAAAFAALKQPATESSTGVAELATPAEVADGTDTTRIVTPAGRRYALGYSPTLTKSADYTVLITDFGATIMVNSSITVTISLPSVDASHFGAWLRIIKLGSGQVTIDAADSDTIDDSGAGGTIYCDDLGTAAITLQLVSATQWITVAATNIWTTTD